MARAMIKLVVEWEPDCPEMVEWHELNDEYSTSTLEDVMAYIESTVNSNAQFDHVPIEVTDCVEVIA